MCCGAAVVAGAVWRQRKARLASGGALVVPSRSRDTDLQHQALGAAPGHHERHRHRRAGGRLVLTPLLLKVHTRSPATLAAKGTTVNVKLREICAGARTGSLTVKLTERIGQQKVRGTGSLPQVLCTNSPEKYLVQVTVKSGPAFKPGKARASGSLSACTTGQHPICGEQIEVRTIQLEQ